MIKSTCRIWHLAALASLGVISSCGVHGPSVVAPENDGHLTSKPLETNQMAGFKCDRCGKHHSELPLNYRVKAPVYYDDIPERERASRVKLSEDQCVLDSKHFFIAGNIEIPIKGSGKIFSYTVWVSLSDQNFRKASEMWDKEGREKEPPYFGWLSTRLPGYPDTVNLKTMVHSRAVGIRPSVELEPTDHPLALEQRGGSTWGRIQEIAQIALHP